MDCSAPPENTFGEKSFVIDNSEAKNIHKENVEFLQKFDEREILDERQRLLESLGE